MQASGECWRIEERDGGVVLLAVWRRADLSRDDVAASLRQTVAVLVPLAGTRRGLVYDLRDAAPTWGPLVHKAYVDVIGAWDVARKPVAVVAAEEPLARISVTALVNEGAPRRGKACDSLDDALAHARS